jgi:hypothetical protein
MGDPTSSYATAGIVVGVSEALKPHHHHHHQVETPSVGILRVAFIILKVNSEWEEGRRSTS